LIDTGLLVFVGFGFKNLLDGFFGYWYGWCLLSINFGDKIMPVGMARQEQFCPIFLVSNS